MCEWYWIEFLLFLLKLFLFYQMMCHMLGEKFFELEFHSISYFYSNYFPFSWPLTSYLIINYFEYNSNISATRTLFLFIFKNGDYNTVNFLNAKLQDSNEKKNTLFQHKNDVMLSRYLRNITVTGSNRTKRGFDSLRLEYD